MVKNVRRYLTKPVIAERWQIIMLVCLAAIPVDGFLVMFTVIGYNLMQYFEKGLGLDKVCIYDIFESTLRLFPFFSNSIL